MNEQTSPSTQPPWWKQTWFIALLLLLATLFAYQPAWNGQPVYDDDDHLIPPELSSARGLWRIWTEVGAAPQYYPVTHTAFWVQHQLWGESMLGYHLVNILLHVLAAFLLGRILQRLAVPGAWLAAAIFALHPVHAESVAWISEIKNTLSGALYLGAALAYLIFDRDRERRFYVIALGLFVLGMLSKGVIASLPAALLVVFWWKRGALSWSWEVRPLLPFFVVGIAGGLFTTWVERKFIGAEGDAFALTLVERFLVAGRALWFYAGKLLWPAELVFIYPRWEISQAVVWQYLFPLAALLFAGALWLCRRRMRGPLASALFFGGTLFPALGFLNVYPFLYSFVADHYVYLASIGVITAAAAGIALLFQRQQLWARPAGNVLCVAVLGMLSVLTWRQSRMYAGVEPLWLTTLAKNPACWVAHSNLANHFFGQGKTDDAIRHARRALEMRPNIAEAYNTLGNALREKGQVDDALRHYQKALEIRPDLAVAHTMWE
ncbi:MAG: tetratricopeptide repeat protein [Nibricoccus sp.]